MDDLNIESKVNTNNLIAIADNLQSEMYKFKINRASDFLLTRHLEFYEKEVDKMKIMITQSPRFKWQFIEQHIDSYFKKDNSLTGAKILFDWNDNVNPNRVLLNFKL